MVRLELAQERHLSALQDFWIRWKNEDSSNPQFLDGFLPETCLQSIPSANQGMRENNEVRKIFLLVSDQTNEILGISRIRGNPSDPIDVKPAGHIAYAIVPSERKKWYATKLLQLSKVEASKLWFNKVLVVCDDCNVGSRRVIEKNGGVLVPNPEYVPILRYWIDLQTPEQWQWDSRLRGNDGENTWMTRKIA